MTNPVPRITARRRAGRLTPANPAAAHASPRLTPRLRGDRSAPVRQTGGPTVDGRHRRANVVGPTGRSGAPLWIATPSGVVSRNSCPAYVQLESARGRSRWRSEVE